MTIRAENDPKYSRRFLFMGIGAIAFGLWFLYDGAVTYPNQRERALAYHQLESESQGIDPVEFRDKWHEMAKSNGWPTSYPGEAKTEGDITMQFVMAGMAGIGALVLLSIPLRARGRWIEATDAGITSSWGQSFNFDQVAEVNKRQWRSKGIAKVIYLDGGRKRRFVIDDYKFGRDATDAILYELEQRIDPTMITNGPPEPPPGEGAMEAANLAAGDSSHGARDAQA
jgi:hypothetical protein